MRDRQTQQDRILALLQEQKGKWVPLPRIMSLGIACHTKRIHELRRIWDIEFYQEYDGHSRHTFYRLNGLKHQQLTVDQNFFEETEGRLSE